VLHLNEKLGRAAIGIMRAIYSVCCERSTSHEVTSDISQRRLKLPSFLSNIAGSRQLGAFIA